VLALFEQLLPASFLEQAEARAGRRHNSCVYTPLVVMWLLIRQRLQGAGSLQAAVVELLPGLPASFWPRPCKRIRDWQQHGKPLSGYTGAYNQARQALPVSIVQESCDRIFAELVARMDPPVGESTPRAFILDGSSMRMAHTPSLREKFPLGSNQHGQEHWPVVRVLVAHDLRTGLAMRPEWGPMHGPEAVSEQKLLERAIGRLPAGSTVIGDANFGVFSVAWAVLQAGCSVLLRMTQARAKRLAGQVLRDGIDLPVVWKPSRDDRKNHPELPPDACLRGRLIVRLVRPDNGASPFLLALFTTLDSSAGQLLQFYGQRWTIETDLRTLKRELRFDQLTCSTPDMATKEIEMGIAAYNLIRAVICIASAQSGIAPRRYSFTSVRTIIHAFAPKIAAAADPQEAKRQFDLMMYYVQQAKLPRRRRKRPSYPRAVWNKGARFPAHPTS
jgi:hypothetical protein